MCAGSRQASEEARPVPRSSGSQPPVLVRGQQGHSRQPHQGRQEGQRLSQERSEDCQAVHGPTGPGATLRGDPEPLRAVLRGGVRHHHHRDAERDREDRERGAVGARADGGESADRDTLRQHGGARQAQAGRGGQQSL